MEKLTKEQTVQDVNTEIVNDIDALNKLIAYYTARRDAYGKSKHGDEMLDFFTSWKRRLMEEVQLTRTG